MEMDDLKLVEEKSLNTAVFTKKFRLQGKNFFLTYPKCTLEKDVAMTLIKAKNETTYVAIASELHLDGTSHLHILICMKQKKNISNPLYFDLNTFHGNYQVARDSDDVLTYIKKSDKNLLESGSYVGNNPSKVQKIAIQNKLLLSKPLHELVDEGSLSLFNYKQIKESIDNYNLDKIKVPDYIPKECYWICGTTGIGKSRYIRDTYPSAVYFKPQNKWWDGFTGEKIVLIDDFDKSGACLGHYLKIWSDCYSFNAEIKGSTIKPVYDKFFITSQYRPSDIWCAGSDREKWDEEMKDAIERRFTICTIENGKLIKIS